MKAMILNKTTDLSKDKYPLEMVQIEKPVPNEGEILIRVFRDRRTPVAIIVTRLLVFLFQTQE